MQTKCIEYQYCTEGIYPDLSVVAKTNKTVFLLCCPGCPANAIEMDLASLTAIKNYSLRLQIVIVGVLKISMVSYHEEPFAYMYTHRANMFDT